ncbi:hypothetical protein [Polyangium jinanense]|uniref:Uncharacterized protein n=1 Tax=Polyangium jinanense TaxID=2829994 RepID=A0A9X3X507_9BACT|nr:hypothetical protein [Polyangium jinanense]MDC3955165.1 hypothetical protein [Polyangium jinanense]MDC3981466.1 hypothetical protein [Polyangium jinanense]
MDTHAALHDALAEFFGVFSSNFLQGQRDVPPFTARLVGASIEVPLKVGEGEPIVLRQRGSALYLLAGRFWAAARASEGHGQRCLLPTLTPYPLSFSTQWKNWQDLQQAALPAVGRIALALDNDAHEEAVLLVRHILDVDAGYWLELERAVPNELRKEVLAKLSELKERTHSTSSLGGHLKVLASHTGSSDPRERLFVAKHYRYTTKHLSSDNHLTFLKNIQPALEAWLKEEDGAIFETAVGIAEMLGYKLFERGAYAEAEPLLSAALDAGIAGAELLRARWECRLYRGDERAAAEDWRAAEPIDDPAQGLSLGFFYRGDRQDRKAIGLGRVARSLGKLASGEDPCRDRPKTKKAKAISETERSSHLARARVFADDAVALVDERARGDEARARAGQGVTDRGFETRIFAARALVREGLGDTAGALDDYRRARTLATAAGLSWQGDLHGDDIRRLEGAGKGKENGGAIPESFDPKWFLASERGDDERSRAAAVWCAEPWRVVPDARQRGTSIPIAFALVKAIVDHSAALWKLGEADGVKLPDRLEFVQRARPLLDRYADRRDADRLESVLDDAHEIAFDVFPRHEKAERAPFFVFLRAIGDAETIDEARVLSALDDDAWSRLRRHLEAKLDELDPLRDVFDATVRTGAPMDAVVAALAAYQELFRNDWGSFATPRPAWEKLAKPLERADGAKLAPALIEFIRREQSVPGHYGLTRLPAKSLWPLFYAWHPSTEAFLLEALAGKLDHGKSLSATQRKTRHECLTWFANEKKLAKLGAALAKRRR